MNEYKPIGEIAKNLLNKLTKDYIEKLCNRHIAMLLSELDHLSDSEKESIKSHMRYFSADIQEQVLGLGDLTDDKTK